MVETLSSSPGLPSWGSARMPGCCGGGGSERAAGMRAVMLTWFLSLGLAAPPTVRIVHSGLACNIEEERYSERVYTIREGETLELTCLVTGHPRPQVSPRRARWQPASGHRTFPLPHLSVSEL